MKIHVLYPGVIDTELFHLPDNDPLGTTGVEMLPVDAMVEPVLTMIEQDQLEVSVPDWFNGVYDGKSGDVAGFLEGTIAFARSQQSASRRSRFVDQVSGEADGLGLEVLLEAGDAVLAALAALLVAAERRVGAEPLAAVDRDRAGADAAGDRRARGRASRRSPRPTGRSASCSRCAPRRRRPRTGSPTSTGPKISSCAIVESGSTSTNSVGCTK